LTRVAPFMTERHEADAEATDRAVECAGTVTQRHGTRCPRFET
jgi:hypothetical protein